MSDEKELTELSPWDRAKRVAKNVYSEIADAPLDPIGSRFGPIPNYLVGKASQFVRENPAEAAQMVGEMGAESIYPPAGAGFAARDLAQGYAEDSDLLKIAGGIGMIPFAGPLARRAIKGTAQGAKAAFRGRRGLEEATDDELRDWLISQGKSDAAIERTMSSDVNKWRARQRRADSLDDFGKVGEGLARQDATAPELPFESSAEFPLVDTLKDTPPPFKRTHTLKDRNSNTALATLDETRTGETAYVRLQLDERLKPEDEIPATLNLYNEAHDHVLSKYGDVSGMDNVFITPRTLSSKAHEALVNAGAIELPTEAAAQLGIKPTVGKSYRIPNVTEVGAKADEIEDAAKEWARKGTDSKYFRRWFGESNPLVDKKGSPIVLFRGGGEGILRGEARGTYNMFASSNPLVASDYAQKHQGTIAPMYAQVHTLKEWTPVAGRHSWMDFDEAASKLGPGEALVYRDVKDTVGSEGKKGWEYMVPDSEKHLLADPEEALRLQFKYLRGDTYAFGRGTSVKSATGNRGTFDPKNPSMSYGAAAALVPASVAAKRAIEAHEEDE